MNDCPQFVGQWQFVFISQQCPNSQVHHFAAKFGCVHELPLSPGQDFISHVEIEAMREVVQVDRVEVAVISELNSVILDTFIKVMVKCHLTSLEGQVKFFHRLLRTLLSNY
ncbi:hypothetical protein CDAR_531561 [Caerostris darwini]|uniref:Uncharacterized protein n=1 Tax=Caerostris darwini TaxID=1538125 RepID=A0AAV4ML18_9ARAC|nr:hypothetical protein CDAR_317651 [Caerostris darwini]GIY10802.1 hypothetical protein CDAR_531561 [Caerostris darwini]